MKKTVIILFFILASIALFLVNYFFIAKAPVQKEITWGIDFSQMQTERLKLDWKKTYAAILDDLNVKNLKLHTQWDFVEGQRTEYYFDDIDWQISQAARHNVSVIYVVGMKTGRWPECHLPNWAEGLSRQEQQDSLLLYIEETVKRYKNNGAIVAWQAENEPLFRFGECPWYDKEFLKKEVALIKSLDDTKPVIISDSGEQSFWLEAAKIGDVVGITTYRKVWVNVWGEYGFYMNFPLPAVMYWHKAQIVKAFFGKEVINIELQAEPWTSSFFSGVPMGEQEKTMNVNQFKKNVTYAKQTGLDTFYFWGAEWWFWLKEFHNKPEMWNTARELFKNGNM